MDEHKEDAIAKIKQPESDFKQAMRVQDMFRAAWTAKQNMRLHEKWRTFDDYYHGRQGVPESADDPNSTTPIIKPIIDSQIADLVSKPAAVQAEGVEFSDNLYATQVQHMLQFVLERNQFKQKLETAEHDRLELGTSIYKVHFDEDALSSRGMPVYDVVNPANFFPDPKISSYYKVQDAEFIIHATWQSLAWFRKNFPERGKYVVRQVSVTHDPKIYEGNHSDESEYNVSDRALCLECYLKDDDGTLYCLTVAQGVLLQDSRKALEGRKLQRRDKYPFVVIPCYPQRGILWGQGDVELLIPTQDLINELDDQIRINARLMGNPQIAFGVGVGRGFNHRLWTSEPGLRVPMRDPNAFRIVEARPVSPDVPARREKAFQEADIISGRPDVTRGETPGSVTAFRAIAALQQAGQRGVQHKKEMFKAGFKEVLELLYDEMLENWDEEMWVRVEGNTIDYKFYNPRDLTQIPELIPAGDETMESLVALLDEEGEELTRDAEFDLNISIGDGLPNDKAFIFDMLVDLSARQIEGKPLISWAEFREYLREEVGISLKDDALLQQQGMPQGMPGIPQAPPQQGGFMPQGGAPIADTL